jgi:hypothetical protein
MLNIPVSLLAVSSQTLDFQALAMCFLVLFALGLISGLLAGKR